MASIGQTAIAWAPRILSVLRIITGLLFIEHGTMKLFNFPPSDMFAGGIELVSLTGLAAILELVGASPSFVRLPYILEGALFGLVAGSLSLVVSGVSFSQLKSSLQGEELFTLVAYRLDGFGIGMNLLLLTGYVGLGLFVSYLCVRRLNSGFAAAKAMKEVH